MFNNPKYLTRGVQSTIPGWLVILLWHLIEIMPVEQKRLPASIPSVSHGHRPAHHPHMNDVN